MARKLVGIRLDSDKYEQFRLLCRRQSTRINDIIEKFMDECIRAGQATVKPLSLGSKLAHEQRMMDNLKNVEDLLTDVRDPGWKYKVESEKHSIYKLLPHIENETLLSKARELLGLSRDKETEYYECRIAANIVQLKNPSHSDYKINDMIEEIKEWLPHIKDLKLKQKAVKAIEEAEKALQKNLNEE